jgi:hypothetical protein
MLEMDAVLYEYVKSIHVIYTDLFLFSGFNRFMHFLSTYANSWIKIAARQNIIWIRFGNRRAVRRRRTEAGMALTAIGEITQWGGVAGCSGSRTHLFTEKIDSFQWNNCCEVHQTFVSHQHLPKILISKMAAPTDCFQIQATTITN